MKTLVYKDTGLAATLPGSNQQAGTPYLFNLGSIFEPRAGGHQPFGFDQMAALYARYKVHKVRIHVETLYVAPGTSGITAGFQVVGVFPPGSAQTTLNVLTAGNMGENFNVSTKLVSAANVVPLVFDATYDIATIAGLTREEFESNVEDYSALVTASPTRYPFLEVNQSAYTAADAAGYRHNVTLTFFVEFWQRISLAGS